MTYAGPIPFTQALKNAQDKGLLPNNLSSFQLRLLERQWRQQSVFSARMDKASVLQTLQDNVVTIAGGMKDERGVYRSVAEAKAQLKEAMFKAGVPLAPVDTPKIQDFYSDNRRDLMVRTTLLDTLNRGRTIAAQDPVALDINPGYELVRMGVPKGGVAAERDWEQRWLDAMDEIGSDAEHGCTDPRESDGRMVALKNHPIWQALGDGAGGYTDSLGNAWAPFAFGSYMNLIDVPRAECVDLGIIGEDEQIEPDDSVINNDNVEARVDRFNKGFQDLLDGDGLKITDGVLRMVRNRRRVSLITASLAQLEVAA